MTAHIVASERDADLIALVLKAQVQQGKLSVEVKPYTENRRRSQENLYRRWCREIATATGNDPDVMHKYLAKRFLGTEIVAVEFTWNGQPVRKEHEEIRSTTALSMKEMSQYMTQVQSFAAEFLGLHLAGGPDG